MTRDAIATALRRYQLPIDLTDEVVLVGLREHFAPSVVTGVYVSSAILYVRSIDVTFRLRDGVHVASLVFDESTRRLLSMRWEKGGTA